MRAVGYQTCDSGNDQTYLEDIYLPEPVPGERDLLVEVKAVGVNPVDYKVRKRSAPASGEWGVLGWDVAGTVIGTGKGVTKFAVGDEVFYAGDVTRPGANAERHLVDERLVGRKPRALSFSEAAAMPLTAITAWEALFERLDVRRPVPGVKPSILIIGGGGGVASIAIQLARQLTDLTVIATSSRPETREWVTDMGAHYVVDHSKPLAAEIAALGIGSPCFVFSTTGTDGHLGQIAELIAPQGRVVVIDDPQTLDISLFKRKSVSVHWEWMFTRSAFATEDQGAQGEILGKLADAVDIGKIRSTLNRSLGLVTALNLTRAHRLLESGASKGKVVLEGFGSD